MSETSSYPQAQLHQVTRRITDGSHFSPTPREAGHLIANVKDMKSGEIDFNTCTRISEAAYKELKATGCTIRNGNVLLSKDGTVGRVVVYKQEDEIGALSSICIIEPTDQLDAAFLGQALQGEGCARQYDNFMSGSALRRLVLRDIRSIKVPLPEPEHQRSIAQILDTLDTAIHETEAIIAKLKAVKQGLLHDLLTRGIDANGELRPPQAEAPHLYKQSSLGWIPKEWEASNVAAEFDIDSGLTLGPHRVPRERPRKYLRVANVHRNRLVLDNVAELEATDVEASTRALRPGDLLIVEGHASTSEIGRCAMADESVSGMLFQNHLFRLRSKRILPEVGLLLLNSKFSQSYWQREAATSSGLNTINRTKLSAMPVLHMPHQEQGSIAGRVSALSMRIDDESSLLAKLRSAKSGLMDDLLTGRVRVTPLLEGAAP